MLDKITILISIVAMSISLGASCYSHNVTDQIMVRQLSYSAKDSADCNAELIRIRRDDQFMIRQK